MDNFIENIEGALQKTESEAASFLSELPEIQWPAFDQFTETGFSLPDLNPEKVGELSALTEHGVAFDDLFSITKAMYQSGNEVGSVKTLGIKDIHEWGINPQYAYPNLKQHAGYAAEVIGTAKENLRNMISGSEIVVKRADDLPELFKRNDQFVDKVRMDKNGNILEKIQVKFVGKNGKECAQKLLSKRYDKYFQEGAVDKIEIPKNYFKDARDYLSKRIESLNKQIKRLETQPEKAEILAKKQVQLSKCEQLVNGKLEKSLVSSGESKNAVKNPKAYASSVTSGAAFKGFWNNGKQEGLTAAFITGGVSICKNGMDVVSGELEPMEAVKNIVAETTIAGGTAFVSSGLSGSLVGLTAREGASSLVRSLGRTGMIPTIVSAGVESFQDCQKYLDGEITGNQLIYNVGENLAISAGGSILGAAAVAGVSALGIAGTGGLLLTASASIAAGMVGVAVAGEVYEIAAGLGSEAVGSLVKEIGNLEKAVTAKVQEVLPTNLNYIKNQINQFNKQLSIPVKLG